MELGSMGASLTDGSVFAASAPLLAKVDATYRLLADVFSSTPLVGEVAPSDDVVARRWLDDQLARARGVELDDPQGLLLIAGSGELRTVPLGHGAVAVRPGASRWEVEHRALFARTLNPDHADMEIAVPSPRCLDVLAEAVRLLDAYVPELAASVLPHAGRVFLVDGADAFESASDRRLPRAIYLSTLACSDAVRAAEALLHEATHQKLYDLQLIYTLYASGYSPQTGPTIHPPWHPPATRWPIDRTTAASHVYVHLAQLYEALRRGTPSGFDPAAIEATYVQARERAAQLLAALAAHTDQFNPNGQAFVALLRTVHAEAGALAAQH